MADIAEKAANQKDGLALDDDGVVTVINIQMQICLC